MNRRDFLNGIAITTGAALFEGRPLAAAEPPPETTRIRLIRETSICLAPLYIAEDLLKAEGFTDVQ